MLGTFTKMDRFLGRLSSVQVALLAVCGVGIVGVVDTIWLMRGGTRAR